jgi:hypothetical protein
MATDFLLNPEVHCHLNKSWHWPKFWASRSRQHHPTSYFIHIHFNSIKPSKPSFLKQIFYFGFSDYNFCPQSLSSLWLLHAHSSVFLLFDQPSESTSLTLFGKQYTLWSPFLSNSLHSFVTILLRIWLLKYPASYQIQVSALLFSKII